MPMSQRPLAAAVVVFATSCLAPTSAWGDTPGPAAPPATAATATSQAATTRRSDKPIAAGRGKVQDLLRTWWAEHHA